MTAEQGAAAGAAVTPYPPYPAYKDSGVEWLGEIPADWEVKRLKFIAPIRISRLESKPAEGVYVGLENVESWTGRLLLDHQPENVDSVVASFEAGDVLFGKLRPYLAKVARPDFTGVCTSEIVPLQPTAACTQNYLMYCLLNEPYIRWLDSLTYGTKMPRVSPEQLAVSFLPLPGLDEQHAIAAFLDRETARIDALVAKKERLIELLHEKRTALITRAVTKGLDPDVPMKDSGVEWLGEIPARWESGALRRFWSVIDCKHRTAVYVDQGLPIVSTTEVKPGRLVLDGPRKITLDDFADLTGGGRRPRRGDIIYSRNASIGAAAYVETDEPFCMGQDVCLITSERDQLYLAYQLNSPVVMGQIEAVSVGSTFERINVAQIKSFDVACPPMSEQRAIAAFLDRETARIDALVAKVREAIERLKELRTALISAAVTGKIDVRQEVA